MALFLRLFVFYVKSIYTHMTPLRLAHYSLLSGDFHVYMKNGISNNVR